MQGDSRVLRTPFIGVYDSKGNILANNQGNTKLFVTSIDYQYDDEDDDICTIKIQMEDPKALDLIKVGRDTVLQLVWGYLNNPLSPRAQVVVRDMVSKYGPNMIYTELQCADYLTYLKTAKANDTVEGSIIEYIRDQAYGKFHIVIKDRGKYIYSQARRRKEEQKQVDVAIAWGSPMTINLFSPYDEAISIAQNKPTSSIGKTIVPEGSRVISVDNSLEPGTWLIEGTSPVKDYLEKVISIPTSNRSTFIVMQDLFNKCPRGPWYVTGRGDTLFIHNRDLGREIYAEYEYKSDTGYLLDFQATTKFENFEKEVISYSGLDPKNRTNYFITDYRTAIENQRNPKEILEDKELTKEQAKEELDKWLALRMTSYPIWGVEKKEGAEIKFWFNNEAKWIEGVFNKPVTPGPLDQISILDEHHPGMTNPQVRAELRKDKPAIDTVVRTNWFTMPLLSYDEMVSVTNNKQRGLSMEKEEADLIIEGDPHIKSEYTIRVTNVHSQHEGHYYIKKCRHQLTEQGYKTTLECLKVLPDSIMTTIGNISRDEYLALDDLTKEDFDKQYKREQLLFGPDLSISYYKPGEQKSLIYTPGQTTTMDSGGIVTISIEDIYLGKYTEDQFTEELIKAYNQPGSRLIFDPEPYPKEFIPKQPKRPTK